MASKTIVFVHGAWVNHECWDKFTSFFEGKGFTCIAPDWPYKNKPVEELKAHPDPALATLGITEIVDHYDKAIRALSEPPILIGHSFGGLFTQMLLDRGLGAAGISIDSAPPKGVLPHFYPSNFRSNLAVVINPLHSRQVIRQSFRDFQYAFVNTLPEAEQKAIYDRYVIPETGRIFFQVLFSPFNNASHVNFNNASRAPLLLISGLADHNLPLGLIRTNYNRYKHSPAVTDLKTFENRDHWIIGEPGWEEVAGYIHSWVNTLPGK